MYQQTIVINHYFYAQIIHILIEIWLWCSTELNEIYKLVSGLTMFWFIVI